MIDIYSSLTFQNSSKMKKKQKYTDKGKCWQELILIPVNNKRAYLTQS